MPLLSIESIYEDVSLGLWQIDESPEDFFHLYPHLQKLEESLDKRYRSDARKRETLAVRALLFEMTRNSELFIEHQPDGKPLLSNHWQLSISHTRGYAALMLSANKRVGVDIEYVSDRVERISRRFIRPDEQAPDLHHKLLNWCAKEAAYKFYSEDRLEYFDMRVRFLEEELDSFVLDNLKRNETITVHSHISPSFILAYCHEE